MGMYMVRGIFLEDERDCIGKGAGGNVGRWLHEMIFSVELGNYLVEKPTGELSSHAVLLFCGAEET